MMKNFLNISLEMAYQMLVAQVPPPTTVQPADLNTVTTCHALLLCDQLDNNNGENISTLLADDVNTA